MVGARDIKISKIIPSFVDNGTTTKGREAENWKDSFAHLATVEYHTIRSSRIRMGNLDIATDDYFKREGWSLTNLGRSVISQLWSNDVSQPSRLGIAFSQDQTAGNISGDWRKRAARQEPQRRVNINRQG